MLDEARHNLVYGICRTLLAAPDTFAAFHLWTLESGSGAAGVLQPRRKKPAGV